jgi:hypothetical protein
MYEMTTEYSPGGRRYYTDKELAGLLGISLGRLRNKLSAGQSLPPRIQPPVAATGLGPAKPFMNGWPRQWISWFWILSGSDDA